MTSHLDTGSAEGLDYADKPDGPVSAAILAGGDGALLLGLFTTLAEANTDFKDFLSFYDPVGPLSGKTIGAIVLWLLTWGLLHMMWKDKEVESARVLAASLILIGLGVLGTFPIFFQAFAPAE